MGLTEPQVWVLIGVFTTAIFGMLSWQTVSFNRTLRSELAGVTSRIDSVEGQIGSVHRELEFFREGVNARFEALESKFDSRFEVVSHKIDSLDRDVQALTRHVFGADPR